MTGTALVAMLLVFLFTWDTKTRQSRCHRIAAILVRRLIERFNGWNLAVEPNKMMSTRSNFVIVANHQSVLDPFLLYFLPFDLRFVAKEWVFKLPVIGQVLSLAGHIRARPGTAVSASRRALSSNFSLVVFPEGTRSTDGEIKELKKGAFRISVSTGTAILPVVIDGTREILPKHGRKVSPRAHVTMHVLDPVYPHEFNNNADLLSAYVLRVMKIELNQMRRPRQVVAEKKSA